MTYESLASLLVTIVLVAFVFWWFPTRATRKMQDATKHSEDRYSKDLELISGDDSPQAKDETPRSDNLTESALVVDAPVQVVATVEDEGAEKSATGGAETDGGGRGEDATKSARGAQAVASRRRDDARIAARGLKRVHGTRPHRSQQAQTGQRTSQGSERVSRTAAARHDATESREAMTHHDAMNRSTGTHDSTRRTAAPNLPPTKDEVRRVRRRRHAAVQRRRVVALALFAVTVLTCVAAAVMRFNALYALIPFVALVVVLAQGAYAAAKARDWERRVAQSGVMKSSSPRRQTGRKPGNRRGEDVRKPRKHDDKLVEFPTDRIAERRGTAAADATVRDDDEARTVAISRNDIRATIQIARTERDVALKARDSRRSSQETHAMAAPGDGTVGNAPSEASRAARASYRGRQAGEGVSGHVVRKTVPMPEPTAQTQTLLSFSLGDGTESARRDGAATMSTAVVRSAEIKSYRQVAQAVPVHGHTEEIRQASQREAAERAVKERDERAAAARARRATDAAARSGKSGSAAGGDDLANEATAEPRSAKGALASSLESALANRGIHLSDTSHRD